MWSLTASSARPTVHGVRLSSPERGQPPFNSIFDDEPCITLITVNFSGSAMKLALRFYLQMPSGWIEDSRLQAVDHPRVRKELAAWYLRFRAQALTSVGEGTGNRCAIGAVNRPGPIARSITWLKAVTLLLLASPSR